MSKFKPIRCLESSIPEEISDGALYITTDTEQLFVDTDSKRLAIKDVITVEDEASLPLAPVKGKLYVALSEKSLWTFTSEWVQIGSGSGGGGYVLPVASKDTLGGVKIDDVTIKIDESGVISGINAYTKVETDVLLDKKQDKLTPNAPLKISSYAKAYGFVGMVSNGAGGYYTDKPHEYYKSTGSTTWEIRFEWNNIGATETTKSHYIDLPFEIGKIYKVPGMKGVNNSFINGVIVGYTPEDNTTFHPSFKVGLSDSTIDIVGRTSMTPAIKDKGNWYTFYTRATGVQSTNYNGETDERMYWSIKDAIEAMPSPENIDPTVAYFQILDEGTYLQMNVLGARYDDGEWLYQRKSFGASHSLMLTKVRQMNTVRIYAALGMNSSGYGSSAENPMLSSQLGIYPTEGNLLTMTSEELLALPNEFVIGDESIKTYLDLNIGAGLTVSDNVLINSNPTPYELPTASTETLGGVKVDGTSIVIADGVISTNAGTGVDTYTKVEVDNLLSAKQDTITPSSPLSITKEVRSNLQGFQYTTDSTRVYTTGDYYWNSHNAPYSFSISNNNLPGSTLNAQTFANKIMIPYIFGQVVKLPVSPLPNGGDTPFCFGKVLNDGTFIPIYEPVSNSRYIIMSDTPTTYGGTYNNLIQMPTTDNGKQNPDTYEQLASGVDNLTYVLIQMLLENTDSNLLTNVMNYSPYSTSQGRPGKGQYNFTQANYINRLKEINCIIIYPTSYSGRNADTAIPVNSIGLYANPGNLYNLITSENYNNIDLGENLFDLSGEQAYNYLDLNIDNNTLKINESNQLFANIPENLTTQGNEFNGANQLVQLDASGKLPAIDGSQLTNLPSSDGYTKSEVDTFLADKQDKLTAVTPITINTYVKSPLNGMTYTGDGQSIYQNVTSEVSYIEKASDSFTLYPSSIQSSSIDDFFKSFVDIPFIEGSVYTLGQQKRSDSYTSNAPWVIGKTLPNGSFIPIFWSDSGGGAKLNLSDTIIAEQNKITFTNVASIGNLNVNAGQSSDTGISHGWLQITSPEETTLKIKVSIPSSSYAQSTITLTITDTAQVARLRECNTVRLVPIGSTNWYAWATSINSAVAISKIGRYQYSGEAPYNLAQENLVENLFKIDVETAQTYLELNFDSKTLKIDDENKLSVVSEDNYNKTEIDNLLDTKLNKAESTNIPVGLEHSISDGVLSVQTGYVKSAKGQLEVTEPLTTADISNVQTGADNGVILGDVTTQRTLEISEKTGKYLFFAGTDDNKQNNMVENNRGSWIFASSSQGTNSTTWPYYGFIFNEEQPVGKYTVTINIPKGYITLFLAKGSIGNLTNVYKSGNTSAGEKTFEIEVTEGFNTIYVQYGNYYNFQVAYDCKITQTVSATEFSTYLCVKDGTQSIKVLNDVSQLSTYTDYAKIGKVTYDATLANPVGYPTEDLANKYLSGKLEILSLGDVITSSNISQNEYIKQLEARITALEALIDGGSSESI